MTISQISARTGVSSRLLRYYEEQSLITPGRDRNGYRVYCDLGVERIEQIRSLLGAGLPTKVIKQVLPRLSGPGITALTDDGHHEVLAALCREAAALQHRIDELEARRAALLRYVGELMCAATPRRGAMSATRPVPRHCAEGPSRRSP
jgi:DNA-binding transcriptional MerR regulator